MTESLLASIKAISDLSEPDISDRSASNNIDVEILADHSRLKALLANLTTKTREDFGREESQKPKATPLRSQEAIARILRLIDEYREAVLLANKACNVQRNALVETGEDLSETRLLHQA